MTVATEQELKKTDGPMRDGRRTPPPHDPSPPPPPLSSSTFTEKLGNYQGWIVACLIGGVLVLFFWYYRTSLMNLLPILSDQDAVSAYVQGYGALGPLVLAAGQLLQVLVAVIPGHVFLVAGGYVYGFVWGFLLNLTLIVAASQLAFALARWAGRPLVSRLVSADLLEKWYRIGEKQGFIFFTIAFVLPVFPTDLMNFVGGLSGISGRKFLAANFLGRLPSAVMLTLIGSHGLEFPPSTWGVIAVLVAVVYVAGRSVMLRIERRHG